jgi:hypothetical protein
MVNSDVNVSAEEAGGDSRAVEEVRRWFCAGSETLLRDICWFTARSDHDPMFPDDLSEEERSRYHALHQAYVAANADAPGFCLNKNMASGLIAREIERHFCDGSVRTMDFEERYNFYLRIVDDVLSYLQHESNRSHWNGILAHCQAYGEDVSYDEAMAMVQDLKYNILNVNTAPAAFIYGYSARS